MLILVKLTRFWAKEEMQMQKILHRGIRIFRQKVVLSIKVTLTSRNNNEELEGPTPIQIFMRTAIFLYLSSTAVVKSRSQPVLNNASDAKEKHEH
jgi:hypothetical protein